MPENRTAVLIVGGGLSGLSAAAFLAWRGVPCLLVERHADLLIHPRARGVTPRTMELYRQVGIEPAIEAASGLDASVSKALSIKARNLAAAEYTPFDMGAAAQLTGASPCAFVAIDQDKLEVVLRDRARKLGAEVRFSTELTGFEQDADGVTATVRDVHGGPPQTVRADYLIAADGHDSTVRSRLGIAALGPGKFAEVASVMFEADLTEALAGRAVGVAYLDEPRPGMVLVRTAPTRWSLSIPPDAGRGETAADLDDRRCLEIIRAAVGQADVDARILTQIPGSDVKLLSFVIGAQVAQRYQQGRIFLVGDAAHIVPPTLGLGGSVAIQDSHNLAWKLAAVHLGHAGPGLLDTYDAERRPVGFFTMQQILAVSQARGGRGPAGGQQGPAVDLGSLVFGYQYRSAAVLGAPDDELPARPVDQLTGQPGTRAPHVPAGRDGALGSTIDLYGTGFVLLAGPDGGDWAAAGHAVAADRDVPLTVYRIGRDLTEDGTSLCAAHGIGADGAILVRPDGFVAWRSPGAAEQPDKALDSAVAEILA